MELSTIDNDAPCCICNETDDSNVNQIIFCDMCNIPVHQVLFKYNYLYINLRNVMVYLIFQKVNGFVDVVNCRLLFWLNAFYVNFN